MSACKAQALPPNRSNCGWFTGEEFDAKLGHACVPVHPELSAMMRDTLTSANPPPGAAFQHAMPRPGNNCPEFSTGVKHGKRPFEEVLCTETETKEVRPAPRFVGYSAY
jgi:hypothetical protein